MKQTFLRISALVYSALMLWLLFIRNRGIPVEDYWTQIAARVNLIPFATIGRLLRPLWQSPYPVLTWTAFYNICGNIVMFIPLGFFLRALFPRYQQFARCMGVVAVIMTTVELIQLFTLRGFFDVDDLILNLTGAAIGFSVAKKSGA